MSTRLKMIVIGMGLALGIPATAVAQDPGFSYLEGGVIGGFVNDVEDSGTITGSGGAFEVENDAGGGGYIDGAWQFSDHLHLFGSFSSVGQELEISGGVNTIEGEFDVLRWRVGVGYAHSASSTLVYYGRLSLDHAEFKDLTVAGFDLAGDLDENGIGGEAGVVWAATPEIHLQGHLRYTSVGEVADEGSDAFDDDILIGVSGRWYFRPDIALVAGYEYGKITMLNAGLRFSF